MAKFFSVIYRFTVILSPKFTYIMVTASIGLRWRQSIVVALNESEPDGRKISNNTPCSGGISLPPSASPPFGSG